MRAKYIFAFCFFAMQLTVLGACTSNSPPISTGLLGRKIEAGERIPGDSDQKRWNLVTSKLEALCSANRDDVYAILGKTMRTTSNSDHAKVWTFQITDAVRRDAFTEGYFQLAISFDGNKVSAVQVAFVDYNVGRTITK